MKDYPGNQPSFKRLAAKTLAASFYLYPIDDFNTIDDTILANLVYDNNLVTNNTTSSDAVVIPQNQNIKVPQPQPPQTINNAQVNTINTTPQDLPHLPQMYFPNSSVTINCNYNFK